MKTTVRGPAAESFMCGVYVTVEAIVEGEWRMSHYVTVDSEPSGADSKVIPAGSNPAFFNLGLPLASYTLRVPTLPPGNYRVRQDVANGRAHLFVTLYGQFEIATDS